MDNKYPCSNTRCTKLTSEPNTLCDDCKRREQMTETRENRERLERLARWERHKRNKRRDDEE